MPIYGELLQASETCRRRSFNRCPAASIKDEFEETGMSNRGNKPRDILWNTFSDIKRFPGIGI
jgi:hypothetical protein